MPTAAVAPGIALHFEDVGSDAAGAPMVFLHGLPVSGRMFAGQLGAISAAGIRCIALDLRGFGHSAHAAGPYDFDAWADDLHGFLGKLELRNVTLVGYSFGGAIAMHYMARHRQAHVGRLVLLAAAGPCMGWRPDNPDGTPPEAYAGLAQLARTDLGQLNTTIGTLLFHTEQDSAIGQGIWKLGMQAAPEAAARGIEELRDRDLRHSLGAITVPTLICQGVHDQVVPWGLGAGAQSALIPNARVVKFEESGHGLFVEEKNRLNAELLGFAIQ